MLSEQNLQVKPLSIFEKATTNFPKVYTITKVHNTKAGYEGTSDPNVLSEQNVPHQKNVLYCSVLTEHFKMFLFCSQEHFQTTENIQVHRDHEIFALNFFQNFQGSKLCTTSLENFNLKTLIIFGFSAQTLHNIANFVFIIIFKMFPGTF